LARPRPEGIRGAALKIALVISSLASGGAERVLTSMANYWAAAGHEVVVVTFSPSTEGDFYSLHPNVHRKVLGFRRETRGALDKILFNFARLRALRIALIDASPDAVVSFMDSTNVLTVLACLNRRVTTLISVRNNPKFRQLPFMWRIGRRLTYRHASCVVAQSEGAARWIRSETAATVCVIPNPVRIPQCIETEREKMILAVGRLIPEKGHDLLISAFARIFDECKGWRLVILGGGPLDAALADHVERSGLTGRVELPGTVKDVDYWYARCGIYVHPSRSEGFPNALIEAMSAGAPVVAADCEFGPGDIICDGEDGLLVPSESEASLAQAIRRLVDDDSLRQRLGVRARGVRERFAMDRIMKLWEAHLE